MQFGTPGDGAIFDLNKPASFTDTADARLLVLRVDVSVPNTRTVQLWVDDVLIADQTFEYEFPDDYRPNKPNYSITGLYLLDVENEPGDVRRERTSNIGVASSYAAAKALAT